MRLAKLWHFFTPQNQTLLRQLVLTDFKLRYQGSVLGYLWSLFKPLLLFSVLYFVFTYALPVGKGVPHYPAYLLLGIVLWTFFVEATTMGMGSIVGRADLIRKVKISKPSIVIASILSAGVNLTFNMVVVAIVMIINHAEIQPLAILFFPLILVELIVLALGISFFLSALYVRFRDFAPIWEVVLQIMFYATPIIYDLRLVAPHHRVLTTLALNPLAQIIQDARSLLITPYTLTTHQVLPLIFSFALPLGLIALLALTAVLFFKRSAQSFAEDL